MRVAASERLPERSLNPSAVALRPEESKGVTALVVRDHRAGARPQRRRRVRSRPRPALRLAVGRATPRQPSAARGPGALKPTDCGVAGRRAVEGGPSLDSPSVALVRGRSIRSSPEAGRSSGDGGRGYRNMLSTRIPRLTVSQSESPVVEIVVEACASRQPLFEVTLARRIGPSLPHSAPSPLPADEGKPVLCPVPNQAYERTDDG